MEVNEYLEKCYVAAQAGATQTPVAEGVLRDYGFMEAIMSNVENCKAVLTVILTSIVYKIFNPHQDIRRHQAGISNGYSGRSFDSRYITPFLQSKKFPAMKESGWLTRSLEQKVPYDKHYPGAIRGNGVKEAFLTTIDFIQHAKAQTLEALLIAILQYLIIKQSDQQVQLAKPLNLSITQILDLLEQHFNYKYNTRGASRLPVLAIFSIYQILIREVARYKNLVLYPLESHLSADSQSGLAGDINVADKNNRIVEAVEVKAGIPVDEMLLLSLRDKILSMNMKRYYILSTSPMPAGDQAAIEKMLHDIKSINGCQVVINGVFESLKYYLRLVMNTASFIEHYVDNLQNDGDTHYEFKEVWNKIVADYTI